MAFEDKTLVCRDCSKEFTFTAGEQEFYESRGLLNQPGRCPDCRREKRRGNSGGFQGPREKHKAVCAQCGTECEVPFEPRGDRPVYCNECFTSMRNTRS
ncbi:MAG: zinc-ribbon domain containing protein [Dehalococcoidia bacterium]|nr:zinc-ribbon domain containing protein [Dehalococcoidia bacterium]